MNKRIEELEAQNMLLREQLQVVKEKQMDITPFQNQSLNATKRDKSGFAKSCRGDV